MSEVNGNTLINLTVSVDMTNVILGALSTQPYDRVAGIIGHIQQQAQSQLAQAAQSAPVAAEPAPAPAAE